MNPELSARAVLVLNLEHVAQFRVDPETWQVASEEQPMGWGVTNMAPFLVDLTNRGVERYGFALRPDYGSGVPGDLGRYDVLGIPRVQAIHAGPLYHTSADVLETISINGLERAARFYAFFIDGVAKASREQIDP
jgi:acetylornithine deacetylase/succinyl-diaminopimelate desuccinylase-like protein